MYLSSLLIDTGGNPDRPRPGRRWLGNIYHVHQRLSMAFPAGQTKNSDPSFLKPYNPQRFEREKFLFRVDAGIIEDAPRAMILVQSESEPDWEYAFQNAPFLLAPAQTKVFHPSYSPGRELRFRTLVNLSKKSSKYRSGDGEEAQGKRISLNWEPGNRDAAIRNWFVQKTSGSGFEIKELHPVNLGWKRGWKKEFPKYGQPEDMQDHALKFRSALLEGTLIVTDPTALAHTIAIGIGAAKAFGFGLLSVAPINR